MNAPTRERIVEIIAVELQVPPEKVRDDVSLRKDLGMDSVAALNILFAAEDAFGVRVPEGELGSIDTIEEMLMLLEKLQLVGVDPLIS